MWRGAADAWQQHAHRLRAIARTVVLLGCLAVRGAPESTPGAPYVPCPTPRAANATRGIVSCVPASAVLDFVALLRTIRSLGTWLPVEVFHNEGELTPVQARWLAGTDPSVSVRRSGLGATAGWSCKPAALTRASFQQVLLLDVDVAPMADLASLFETREFRRTGTLFFRDMAKRYGPLKRSFLRREIPRFDISPYERWPVLTASGLPNGRPSAQLQASLAWTTRVNNEAESSVVLLDRCRQPRVAAILADKHLWLTGHSHGDKESYWLAAELAGADYAFSPYPVGGWGVPAPAAPGDAAAMASASAGGGDGSSNGSSAAGWVCEAMLAQFHPSSGALAWLHGEKQNRWLERTVVSRARAGARVLWTKLSREEARRVEARVSWRSRDCIPLAGQPLSPAQLALLRRRVAERERARVQAEAAGIELPLEGAPSAVAGLAGRGGADGDGDDGRHTRSSRQTRDDPMAGKTIDG